MRRARERQAMPGSGECALMSLRMNCDSWILPLSAVLLAGWLTSVHAHRNLPTLSDGGSSYHPHQHSVPLDRPAHQGDVRAFA